MKKQTPDLDRVNKELDRRCGAGKVQLLFSANKARPFTLRFEEDDPPQWRIKSATKTVKKMTGIVFFMNEARVVK